MKRAGATTKPNDLSIECSERGIKLLGSILSLDDTEGSDVSFVSAVSTPSGEIPKTNKTSQVLATEETVRLLTRRGDKLNALVCQYNRPFSIGRLKMELLPSGCVLGGASLYIEHGRKRILYAPYLQTQRTNISRQMQLKRADSLIIGAFHPDPSTSMPNRRKEKERLVSSVLKYLDQGLYPIIFCHEVGLAQEITKELTEMNVPLALHRSTHRVNKIYEQFGTKLGRYSLYDPRHTKNKVLIFPIPEHGRARFKARLPNGPVIYVEGTLGKTDDPEASRHVYDRFFISETADGKEVREIIQAVSPKDVYVFGPYAKQYCQELKSISPKVHPLFVYGQPSLF